MPVFYLNKGEEACVVDDRWLPSAVEKKAFRLITHDPSRKGQTHGEFQWVRVGNEYMGGPPLRQPFSNFSRYFHDEARNKA